MTFIWTANKLPLKAYKKVSPHENFKLFSPRAKSYKKMAKNLVSRAVSPMKISGSWQVWHTFLLPPTDILVIN